jgi:hypothetical protein
MYENNFEKQVREKMDQLGFDPSDTVWAVYSGYCFSPVCCWRVEPIILLRLKIIQTQ